MAGKFKSLIDATSFYDCLWIQGSIQVFVLWGIRLAVKQKRFYFLFRVALAEIILACLLNVPFTGAGSASVADVQRIYNTAPKGIHIPALTPIRNYDSLDQQETSMVGAWSFYNKQPGVLHEAPYPIKLKSIAGYLERLENNDAKVFTGKSLVFIADSSAGEEIDSSISIKKFTGKTILIEVQTEKPSRLVYQQSIYPHWKVYVNGVERSWQAFDGTFLSANLGQGKNIVEFRFEFPLLIYAMIFSGSMLILFVIVILAPNRRKGQNTKG